MGEKESDFFLKNHEFQIKCGISTAKQATVFIISLSM